MFQFVTAEERATIERLGRVRQVAKGTVLLAEGETGKSCYVVRSGRVEVRKKIEKAGYKRLVTFGAGDVVGEAGFVGITPRTASVVAASDCEVVELDRDDVERLIEGNPGLGVRIYRGIASELAARLSHNNQDLMDTIAWALGKKQSAAATAEPA
jgi:CRP-like cAMP-binding protein